MTDAPLQSPSKPSHHGSYVLGILSGLHNVYHVMGAIFKLDEQGHAIDFMPIDFDGQRIREWPYNNYGSHPHKYIHYTDCDKALFIPISEESARLAVAAVDEIREKLPAKQNPYYFCPSSQTHDPRFERTGLTPIDYDGNPRPIEGVDPATFERDPSLPPRIATNCVSFLFNTLMKKAGIPLADMSFQAEDGTRMSFPVHGTVTQLRSFIEDAVGNKNKLYNQRKEGALVDGMNERQFLAFDSQHGQTDAAGNLNDLLAYPKGNRHEVTTRYDARKLQGVPDAERLPVARYLLENVRPWHDPTLNQGVTLTPSPIIHRPIDPAKTLPRGPIQIDNF